VAQSEKRWINARSVFAPNRQGGAQLSPPHAAAENSAYYVDHSDIADFRGVCAV
jgi:hypothetical protein